MKQKISQINSAIVTKNIWRECKNNIFEKDYVWNPATCSCENGKYLASILDDSVIICDEIIYAEKKC